MNTRLTDVITQAILAGKALSDIESSWKSKKKSETRRSHQKSWSNLESCLDLATSNLEFLESSSNGLETSSKETVKNKSHKHRKFASLGLGKAANRSDLKEIWCMRCHNPRHSAYECAMNEKWRAFYTSNSHNTSNCFYNGRGRQS